LSAARAETMLKESIPSFVHGYVIARLWSTVTPRVIQPKDDAVFPVRICQQAVDIAGRRGETRTRNPRFWRPVL